MSLQAAMEQSINHGSKRIALSPKQFRAMRKYLTAYKLRWWYRGAIVTRWAK